MAVNKYKSHVWVVPEDDATRQLANGFLLNDSLDGTCIFVCPPAGGWPKVLADFESTHVSNMRAYPLRHLVLLVDFDDQVEGRTKYFRERFPDDVSSRVYLLGTRNEPEPLRHAVGKSLEQIGLALAKACIGDGAGLWGHDLLKHNGSELDRLTASVRPFLFR